MMKKNWLTTVGGIMAGMSGVPIALGASHIAIPNWLNVTLFLIGSIGVVVVGVAAKGQDEHSTADDVQDATNIKLVKAQEEAWKPKGAK